MTPVIESEWIDILIADGFKMAHPNDGWVDRDKNEFNRLRICINTKNLYDDLEKSKLENKFNLLKQKFEKIHLHLISEDHINIF